MNRLLPVSSRGNRARALVALGAVVLAGCAGPVEPLAVQTQALPVNLILGQHLAVAQAPLAPIILPAEPLGPAVFLAAVTPSTEVLPPLPKVVACPAFNPLAPVRPIPTSVSGAPAPTSYVYRSSITDVTGSTTASYDGPTRWSISAAKTVDRLGDFTYQVAASVPTAGFSKTTTYEVVPTGVQAAGQPVPGNAPGNPLDQLPPGLPQVAGPANAGIYLDGVTDSSGSSFIPSSPIPLVQFPIQVGASYTTSGTDGNSTVTFTSDVVKQSKVNACGTPVAVWEVALTNGVVSAAGTPSVDFTETLDIATQSGGLVVSDDYRSKGSQVPSGQVAMNQTDAIDVVPKGAG